MSRSGAFPSRGRRRAPTCRTPRECRPPRRLRRRQAVQLLDNLGLQRLRVGAGRDHAVLLASAEVEEHAGQAKAVRARSRPVDVAQPLRTALGAGLEREIAVLMQPAVQVHAAAKRVEPVIRDHHQQVARAELRHHAADQRVVVRVQLPDGIPVLPRLRVRAPPGGPARGSARTCAGCDRWRRTRRPGCRGAGDRATRRTSTRARDRCRRSAAGTSRRRSRLRSAPRCPPPAPASRTDPTRLAR